QRFAFAALEAFNPMRVDVGGIDERAARVHVAVEDTVRNLFVVAAAEVHRAETHRADIDAGFAEWPCFHPLSPVMTMPLMKYRWAKKNNMMTGSTMIAAAAICRSQRVVIAPRNCASPMATV